MNQLEHLKALRDKARIQTEQAEAVLKQQGEISESLDKLIAALEETDGGDVPGIDKISLAEASGSALAAVGVPPLAPKSDDADSEISDPEEEGVVESLGQLIANLEESPDDVKQSGPLGVAASNLDSAAGEAELDEEDSDDDEDSAEWVSEEKESQETGQDEDVPPRLEPIVWEVSDATPVAAGGLTEADVKATEDTAPVKVGEESSGDDGDYKFVKLGDESVAESDEDSEEDADQAEDSKGIAPLAGLAAAGTAAVAGAAHLLGGDDSEEEDGLIDRIKEKGEDWKEAIEEKVGDSVDTIKEEIGIGEDDDQDEVAVEEVNESDDTAPVPPMPPSLGIEPVSASINEVEEPVEEVSEDETEDEAPSIAASAGTPPPPIPVSAGTPPPPIPVGTPPPPIPVPPMAVPPMADRGAPELPPVPQPESDPEPEAIAAVSPEPAAAPPKDGDQFQGAHSSNIFFDANSAYLKESELTKLKTIADAVAGSEARVVKIQGLEDLASSNDFKELLASRRLLAVRKRLAEHGLEESQLTVAEIKLSDEGRVLEPPSISMTPA